MHFIDIFVEVCDARRKTELGALVRLPAASELDAAIFLARFRVAPAGVRQARFGEVDGVQLFHIGGAVCLLGKRVKCFN
jgi:hypothetical protein